MDDETRDFLLDQVRDDQLTLAAQLSKAVQEHEAWQAFVHAVKLEAAKFGQEAVSDAAPFLIAALKLAVAAA